MIGFKIKSNLTLTINRFLGNGFNKWYDKQYILFQIDDSIMIYIYIGMNIQQRKLKSSRLEKGYRNSVCRLGCFFSQSSLLKLADKRKALSSYALEGSLASQTISTMNLKTSFTQESRNLKRKLIFEQETYFKKIEIRQRLST